MAVRKLSDKMKMWLFYYLDESCSTTFMNKTQAARKAGYKDIRPNAMSEIGCQNATKLKEEINSWLDEYGLTEERLKLKLISLVEAKETKFLKIKGYIGDDDLPDGAKAFGTSGLVVKGKDDDGEDVEKYSAGETIIGIDIEAIETQRKTLDMALKVKGMNAPIVYDHNVKLKDMEDAQLDLKIAALEKKAGKS